MIYMNKKDRWYIYNESTRLLAFCNSRQEARDKRSDLSKRGINAEIGRMTFVPDLKA